MSHNQEHSHHHVMPLWIYLAVGTALLFLTVVTVAVAYVNFNELLGIDHLNVIIAMIIATFKGTLVVLFFMHLLYDSKINFAVFGTALLFLGVFIGLTMFDTLRRGDIHAIEDGNIGPAIIYDESGRPKDAKPDAAKDD